MLLSIALEDAGSQLWSMGCNAKWFSQKSAAFGPLFHFLCFFLCVLFFFFQLLWVFPVHVRAFSHCSERGLLFAAVQGLLLLQSIGSRHLGSAVMVHRFCCSTACAIFPDQGSNSCPLYWQADSQSLAHQGSLWTSVS